MRVVPALAIAALILSAFAPTSASARGAYYRSSDGSTVHVPYKGLLTAEIMRLFGPHIHAFGQDVSAEDLSKRIVEGVKGIVAKPKEALLAGGAVVGAPAISVLMLVVLFYFLNSGRQLVQSLLHLVPPRYRGHLAHLGSRVMPTAERFSPIRGSRG